MSNKQYQQDQLQALWENGSKAWGKIPDATAFVEELRGHPLETELAAAQSQIASLRDLINEVIPRYSEMFEALNLGSFKDSVIASMTEKILSNTAPEVVSKAEHERVKEELAAYHREALSLATHLAKHEFPEVSQWKPLDNVPGLISQIDNMMAGVRQRRDQAVWDKNAAEQDAERLALQLKHLLLAFSDNNRNASYKALAAHEVRKGDK